MSKVVYVSRAHLERKKGPLRTARLPGEAEPIKFSVHDEIAKHYGVDETKLGEPHAATIDYVVAATAG
jgi:hypothetical protein